LKRSLENIDKATTGKSTGAYSELAKHLDRDGLIKSMLIVDNDKGGTSE
jgi:hypothetical protein